MDDSAAAALDAFEPGLELSRSFYAEVVAPLLAGHRHSAGLLEHLGVDATGPIGTLDWLTMAQQKLLGVTAVSCRQIVR